MISISALATASPLCLVVILVLLLQQNVNAFRPSNSYPRSQGGISMKENKKQPLSVSTTASSSNGMSRADLIKGASFVGIGVVGVGGNAVMAQDVSR